MADDSFLGFLKDAVNSVPILGTYTQAAWGQGNYDPNAQPNQDVTVGSVANAIPGAHVIGEAMGAGLGGLNNAANAAGSIPLVGNIAKMALDIPGDVLNGMNQIYDATMSGVQVGTQSDGSFVNGWRQSWDTYGQPGHVSGGDILGADIAGITGAADGSQVLNANPGTKQGADTLRAAAKSTWYSTIPAAISDLAIGFVNPVGEVAGVAKASSEANVLTSGVAVDKVAEGFNKALDDGSINSLPKGSTAIVPHLTTDNRVARFSAFVDDVAANTKTPTQAMYYLAPKMENATEDAKVLAADVTSMINKYIPDPLARRDATGNALLGFMGSDAAKDRLKASNPLVFSAIAESMGPPSHLGRLAQAQQLMLEARASGEPVDAYAIANQVFDTPARQAQLDGLDGALKQATEDAKTATELRSRMLALKPSFRQKVGDQMVDTNFDTARLRESRDNAVQQHENLKAQLAEAQADLNGSSRWSGAADKTDTSFNKASFNQATGAAQQRVADLTQQVAQAGADRQLLEQTPLNDPDAMGKWQQQMSAARLSAKDAATKRDLLAAQRRVSRQSLADDMKSIEAMQPALDATHNWLAKIDQIGDADHTWVDPSVKPNLLSQLKTAHRNHVGETYLFDAGDRVPRTFFHLHPKETLDSWQAKVGTQYGNSTINVADRYRGQQQLAMYMKVSKVFSGDEIRAASDKFITLDRGQMGNFATDLQDEMFHRIAAQHDLSDATAKHLTDALKRGSTSAHQMMSDALKEAERDQSPWAKLRENPLDDESSDAPHNVTTAFLRSHLADNVSFIDPIQLRKTLARAQGMTTNLDKFLNTTEGTIHLVNNAWKLTNLVRPGLFFRNMLDTGLRSLVLMGVAGTTMAAQNGVRNAVKNMGVRVGDWAQHNGNFKPGGAVERVALTLSPENVVKYTMADKGVKIPVGNGKTAEVSLYPRNEFGQATQTGMASMRSAFSRGVSPSDYLSDAANLLHDRFLKDKQSWAMYEPDHPAWPAAYTDQAQVLLASPAVRRLASMESMSPLERPTGTALRDYLFQDPAVRAEYNQVARNAGEGREEWIDHILTETDKMFPVDGMMTDLINGKVTGPGGKKWIEENFPRPLRFRVPGYESRLTELYGNHTTIFDVAKNVTEKAFRVLMDNPDFWIVRHPVALKTFADQVKVEAQALIDARIARDGEDAEFTDADIQKITNRARVKAVTSVRNYGFDTTARTVFSVSAHRLSPFYGVWADVMRAYSKLIYDDPTRLGKLTGLWNSPTNISQYLPQPLTVDVNGNPVAPGQVPKDGAGEVYITLNSIIGGKHPFGVDLSLRRSSFNAILMGEVPWLPGWGPAVNVPARILAVENPDKALAAANSDNPIVQTIMKSLWPDGQVPKGDGPTDILGALTPPVWKHVVDGYSGETFWKNVQYNLNQQHIDAERTGQPWDEKKALANAEQAARNANTVLLISQGVFGISGKSTVQGQFYADQMHQLMGLTPDQVKAYGVPSVQALFDQKFPEAKGLDWSFTKNDTGISATYKAQDEALRLKDLIDKQPDLGWFILGGDNVGGQFSQTAYNQQQDIKYGITGSQGREQLSAGDVMKKTVAGFGWQQFTQYTTALAAIAQQYGYSPKAIATAKAAFIQRLGQQNPDWFTEYNDKQNKIADFYNEADLLAKDPKLAGRQDIGMYVQYRQVMDQVMKAYGITSLAGSGRKSAEARAALDSVGTQMAQQNIGFQQMWERMLYNDVKPRASDARYGYVNTDPSAG